MCGAECGIDLASQENPRALPSTWCLTMVTPTGVQLEADAELESVGVPFGAPSEQFTVSKPDNMLSTWTSLTCRQTSQRRCLSRCG